MAVETHYHTDGPASDSSGLTAIVAIIAILFIIGLGVYALRANGLIGNTVPAATTPGVNVDLDASNDGNMAPAPGSMINP